MIENSNLMNIHCFCVNYGLIALANGRHIKIIAEHNSNEILMDQELASDYPGDQINGITIEKLEDHYFIFISRNGNFINVLEVVEEDSKFIAKHCHDIDAGKNVNSISFGKKQYSSYFITCLDYFELPYFSKYENGSFNEVKFNLDVPWLRHKQSEGIEADQYSSRARYSMKSDWDPERPIVAIGLEDGFCMVWNVEDGKLIANYENETKDHNASLFSSTVQVRTVTFSPNPDIPLLVFGESKGYLHFVDTIMWTCQTIKAPSNEEINGIKFTNDGKTLIVAFSSRLVEYKITVGIPPLFDLCMGYIKKNKDNLDISNLPDDLKFKIVQQ